MDVNQPSRYRTPKLEDGGAVKGFKAGDVVMWKGNKYTIEHIGNLSRYSSSPFAVTNYYLTPIKDGLEEVILDSPKGLSKHAKGGKVMYAKGGGISRSQKQYNKMVDEYKYFVVDLEKKRALSGWEYKEDANDEVSHYDGDKNFKVVAERTLSSMGIENPKERFITK
jgi:hypothetical protein